VNCEQILLETGEYKFTIVFDKERVNKEKDKIYNSVKNKISIPGFRKGKIPRKVIEMRIGKSFFNEEVEKNLLPESMIEVFSRMDKPIESHKMEECKHLEDGSLKIDIIVTPFDKEILQHNYKNLKVEVPVIKVKEEDIDKNIDRMRENYAKLRSCDEKALEKGDFAILDYEVKDGETVIEKKENRMVHIGTSGFSQEFEENLIGMKIGEEKEFEAKVKKDDSESKKVKVLLREIKVKELPEVNDEFAKLAGYNSLSELKETLRKNMETMAESKNKELIEEAIIEELLEKNPFTPPTFHVRQELNSLKEDITNYLKRIGWNYEYYVEQMKKSGKDVEKELEEKAMRNVRVFLLLKEIFKKENMELSPEDWQEYYKELAERFNKSVEEIKKSYEGNDYVKKFAKDNLVAKKVIKFLIDSAEVIEKEPDVSGSNKEEEME